MPDFERWLYLVTAVGLAGLVILNPGLFVTTLRAVDAVIKGAYRAVRGNG